MLKLRSASLAVDCVEMLYDARLIRIYNNLCAMLYNAVKLGLLVIPPLICCNSESAYMAKDLFGMDLIRPSGEEWQAAGPSLVAYRILTAV
jgi:hypothetical protein